MEYHIYYESWKDGEFHYRNHVIKHRKVITEDVLQRYLRIKGLVEDSGYDRLEFTNGGKWLNICCHVA